MRLTIAQLETFYWIAQLGSAHAAAQHLNLAQPTISLRLKELRDTLGADLFERTSRGLSITAEGRALLPHVTVIMGELSEIKAKDAAKSIAGPMRVGLAEGFAVNCLPSLLAGLRDDHPHLRPEWNVSTSTTLEAAILDDRLDIAVILNPVGHEKLSLQPLGLQPTCWVAPSSWRMSEPVTPRDMSLYQIISNPAPSAMYRQITGWFATGGLVPPQMSVCTSVAVIAELVVGGLGAGLLPVKMAERFVHEGGMQIIVTDPPVENGRLYIGFRAGSEDARSVAVARTIARVISGLDYLIY